MPGVGVSLALSELCQDENYGGDRIPLPAILGLSTLIPHFTFLPRRMNSKSNSEAASKRVHSAGPSCGERRSQAAHPASTLSDPLTGSAVVHIFISQANEGVVFFDPFKEYVIVPEATRQRWAISSSRFFDLPQLTRPDVVGTPCDAENC